MFCFHEETLKIMMGSYNRSMNLKRMRCDEREIFPSTKFSDDMTHYGAPFTRRYPSPDERGCRGTFAAWNWNRRYEPVSQSDSPKILDLANVWSEGLFTPSIRFALKFKKSPSILSSHTPRIRKILLTGILALLYHGSQLHLKFWAIFNFLTWT